MAVYYTDTPSVISNGEPDGGPSTKIGGKATAALPAAVDEGDRVDASLTLQGEQRVAVTSGTINIGTVAAVVSVALDGTGGTPDTVGIVDAAGDRVLVTAGGLMQVDGSGVTQPVSAASLPLPTGAATAVLQTQPGVDIGDVTINNAAGAAAVNVQDGGNSLTVDGAITANAGTGTFVVKENRPAVSAVTSVAASASNVTLLASNANRLGASFYNDSTKNCFLKLGTTASSSSFTIKMAANSFYELLFPAYTGIIDGIWDVANGNMRVTELT